MNTLEFFTDQELIAELERRGYLVAPRKPLDKRAKCDCGECRRCKVREAVRRYRMRRGEMKRTVTVIEPEPVLLADTTKRPWEVKCHFCEKEATLACVRCGLSICIWHAYGSPEGMVCIACFG